MRLFITITLLVGCLILNAQNYDFDNPTKVWRLPTELLEVSGLHYFDGKIAMLQDEKGTLYLYDPQQEKISKSIVFREKGDFEGVTILENTAYCIRSNGKISVLENFLTDTMSIRTIKTPLGDKNDVEGLVFDKRSNSLLLACKEDAGIEEKIPHTKAIYRFDLETETLMPEPFVGITDDAIENFRKQQHFSLLQRLSNWFNDEFYSFKPSGIAIHPKTGHLYILAHKGKKIIIWNQNAIIDILDLPPTLFPQAEGITFAPNGNLYISNEGKNGLAKLMLFELK